MKTYLLASLVGGTIALAASVAHSQYYVRGDFNGWSGTADELIDQGGGLLTYHLTGLTAGQRIEFKITNDDWSDNWPNSNAQVMADANGEILFRAFTNETWSDGWLPANTRRVGYSDSGLHGWDLAGSMNGWNGGSAWEFTDLGSGQYRGEFFLNAGTYEYKFRKTGDWNVSIGDGFGSDNISLEIASADTYVFDLDLWNGRYNVAAIPEPSTYAALFGLGALTLAFLRRRRAAR